MEVGMYTLYRQADGSIQVHRGGQYIRDLPRFGVIPSLVEECESLRAQLLRASAIIQELEEELETRDELNSN